MKNLFMFTLMHCISRDRVFVDCTPLFISLTL